MTRSVVATCFIVLFLPLVPLSAQMEQRVIPVGSPLYGYINSLYIEAGRTPPFPVYPWTAEQAEYYLDRISTTRRAPERTNPDYTEHEEDSTKRACDSTERAIGSARRLIGPSTLYQEPGGLAVNIGGEASLETYLKRTEDTEWQYAYGQRSPLIAVDLDIGISDWYHMSGIIDVRQEYFAPSLPDTWINISPSLLHYDTQLPFRAYGSLGGKHWNLQVGRDKMAIGPGHTGKLFVSGEPHYLDRLQFTTWWDHFQYTNAIIYFRPLLTETELESEWAETVEDMSKYMMVHRFDLNFSDRINFALSEGYMWGGKYPDIRFLNPLMIFHNLFQWEYASSMLSLELQINPWRYINLYGQIVWNQFDLFHASMDEPNADVFKNAMGFMAGIEGRIPLGGGYLVPGFEFVHTDPLLYTRENPLIGYHWRRKIYSKITGTQPVITEPLGYRYGPDTNCYALWLRYEVPGFFSAGVDAAFALDGIREVDGPYDPGLESAAVTTPTAAGDEAADFMVVTDIHGEVRPFRFLRLGTHLFFVYNENFQHQRGAERFDVQWIFTVTFSLNTHAW